MLVMSSFEYDDGKMYDMVALTLMPNHVHVVFRLKGELDQVIKTWKSFTAHRANQILCRRGTFWQNDYYDVLIRDSDQLQRTIKYVIENPVKAGLSDWPHTRSWPDRIAELL